MHADDVFQFIERCQERVSPQEVLTDLLQTSAKLGFDHLLFSGVPVGQQELAPLVELNGWPVDWFDRYNSQAYFRTDGVCLHAARTLRPFAWNEVPSDVGDTDASRQVSGDAADHGIHSGFVVPLLSLDHWQSAISFASSARRAQMSSIERAQLVTMATFTGTYVQSLALEALGQRDEISISDREREVLRWYHNGKTAWEIGEILQISERTANKHLTSARRKLGVATTRQAVAEAARRRLLHF